MTLFVIEIIWVIITVAEGGLLGLTQQMSTFSSLGSPGMLPTAASMAPPETNSVPRNPFGVSSSSFHGSSDHSSLTMDNNQVSINDSNEMEEMRSGCQVSLNGSFDGSPLVIHNLNIDRLKSTPVDDNQENCFKICNDVLNQITCNGNKEIFHRTKFHSIPLSTTITKSVKLGCSLYVEADITVSILIRGTIIQYQ